MRAVSLILLVPAILTAGSIAFSQSRIPAFDSEHDVHVARFGEILRILRENYVDEEEVDYDKLVRAAIEGMLESLDDYSRYLPPEKFLQLQEQTRQEFGGVGIRIERRDGRITVVAPIADTPGERAGILAGDRIVGVDGEVTTDFNTSDISDLLRGKPGTEVTLTLYRPENDATFEVTVVREIIEVESVPDAWIRDDAIGYIRISRFGERTGREFLDALEPLEAADMAGLILDLRNNPGGLLSAAVEVAGRFFDRGEVVVYTQGREKDSRNEIRSRTPGRDRKYPIAVLINSGSASAAEIVAGALQDTGRAVVVGQTSFGKGSVQRIETLREGAALRYTSARYYTPGGATIHERGVAPDIEVLVPAEDAARLLRQRNRPDLDPMQFLDRFGHEPIVDKQIEAAVAALRRSTLRAEVDDKAEAPPPETSPAEAK